MKQQAPTPRAGKSGKLLTIHDIARRWGVSHLTVYRRVRAGKLKCVRIADRVSRFRLSELERYEQSVEK